MKQPDPSRLDHIINNLHRAKRNEPPLHWEEYLTSIKSSEVSFNSDLKLSQSSDDAVIESQSLDLNTDPPLRAHHQQSSVGSYQKVRPQSSPIATTEQGKAAEYLVLSDLLLSGYRAFLTDQGCPYDLVIDQGGGSFIRVQVKSTHKMRARTKKQDATYVFELRRSTGYKRSTAQRKYRACEYDLLALVATDIRTIAYIPKASVTITILKLKAPNTPQKNNESRLSIDKYPIHLAIEKLKCA